MAHFFVALVAFAVILIIASPGTFINLGAFLFDPKTDAFLETVWRFIQATFWVVVIGALAISIISFVAEHRSKGWRQQKSGHKSRSGQSEAILDPEERRLWWLAEQEAKVEVSEWEKRTGKRKRPAEIGEITRRLFEEIKENPLRQG
jgi:hypothetical protein